MKLVCNLSLWIFENIILICKKLFNILEAFNLQQHIKNSTHKSGHLLDYIISDGRLINSVSVSDFISDHCATCYTYMLP